MGPDVFQLNEDVVRQVQFPFLVSPADGGGTKTEVKPGPVIDVTILVEAKFADGADVETGCSPAFRNGSNDGPGGRLSEFPSIDSRIPPEYSGRRSTRGASRNGDKACRGTRRGDSPAPPINK